MRTIEIKMDGVKTVSVIETSKTVKEIMELLKEFPCIAYIERPNGASDIVNVSAYSDAEVERITKLALK